MSGPLVSVIIPTVGNRPGPLDRAVRSAMRQSVSDLECIVVADAPGLHVELPPDPRLRVVQNSGARGAASARNQGLRSANGRFVTFLDDDDEYMPDRLEVGLQGLGTSSIALCWRSRAPRADRPEWRRLLTGDIRGVVHRGPVPHLGQVMLAREDAPTLDERYTVSEDVEWWVRASRVGPATTIRRIGYVIHDHPGARQTDRIQERFRARQKLLEDWSAYFANDRWAAAYQWKRLGGLAWLSGDGASARRAFAHALRLRPQASTLAHLAAGWIER
jgi:glycosyl transferase family 2